MLLEEAGYDTIEEHDAAEALARLESCPAVKVMVTDLRLPGGPDGLSLINQLRARGITIPAILSTGDGEHLETLPPNTSLLKKPFHYGQLLASLQEAEG